MLMGVDPVVLFALMSMTLLTAATPGPDVFYMASHALTGKWLRGLMAWWGIVCGILIYVLATALGLAALFAAFPFLHGAVLAAGVVYLLYLSWVFFQAARGGVHLTLHAKQAERSLQTIFLRGLFVTLLNPKAALFFTALLPQFVDFEAGYITSQFLILGLGATCAGQVVYGGYTVLFVFIGRKLKADQGLVYSNRFYKAVNFLCAAVYFAFSLALVIGA